MNTSRKADQRALLSEGLQALQLDHSAGTLDALLAYVHELERWNKTYNLISSADLPQMVPRHLLDSLTILPWLQDGALLDAGTGAGLPGIPVAVMQRQRRCTLVDSAGKKIRFLNHIKRMLALSSVEPVHARLEDLSEPGGYENICSRAFASLADFATAVRHLAGAETRLLAMKGRHPANELDALPDWVSVLDIQQIDVPGLHAERHLVMMSVVPSTGNHN